MHPYTIDVLFLTAFFAFEKKALNQIIFEFLNIFESNYFKDKDAVHSTVIMTSPFIAPQCCHSNTFPVQSLCEAQAHI